MCIAYVIVNYQLSIVNCQLFIYSFPCSLSKSALALK